jgi:MFS-type transporter involved in bile tolerance (Atg22 family)
VGRRARTGPGQRALASGFLAEQFGLRPVVLVSSLIGVVAPVLLLGLSPIRRLTAIPAPAADADGT